MTREEKTEMGKYQAQKDIESIKKWDCMKEVDGFRVIGNPYGGKWASERKISLLHGAKKIHEIKCGYGSIQDEEYFKNILSFIKKFVEEKQKK